IRKYGLPEWFRIGDRDVATHITRTALLDSGLTLSEVTARMAQSMGVKATILPATNDPVRTQIETESESLGFQEFFVRERWQPAVRSAPYVGAAEPHAEPAVLNSIRASQLVIVAPSNPSSGVRPMHAIHHIRDALRCTRAEVVAINPLIGDAAFS